MGLLRKNAYFLEKIRDAGWQLFAFIDITKQLLN